MAVNYRPVFDVQALKANEQSNFAEHNQYLGGIQSIDLRQVAIGDVLQLFYDGTNRLVFCTNPGYPNKNGKMLLHALTLHKIDRETVLQVAQQFPGDQDPKVFYDQSLRSLVAETDSYRTYDHDKISQLAKVNYHIDLEEDDE